MRLAVLQDFQKPCKKGPIFFNSVAFFRLFGYPQGGVLTSFLLLLYTNNPVSRKGVDR